MVESANKAPILILHELDQRSRQYAHNLPQQVEVKTTWDGIGLRLGDAPLVVPMEQVKEILTSASISRIPGAKDWVRGVANVRGNLLPILDLKGFVFGKVAKMKRSNRILVMHYRDISAGLVVDEVLGMRHFLDEEYSRDISEMDAAIKPLLSGLYRQGGTAWGVLDIHRLTDLPEFMHVTAA